MVANCCGHPICRLTRSLHESAKATNPGQGRALSRFTLCLASPSRHTRRYRRMYAQPILEESRWRPPLAPLPGHDVRLRLRHEFMALP
eukprot:9234546-Pyramimonas_sp.AAC.1